MSHNNIKRYKKGERLFSEGDVLDKVFIIQSGRVSLFIERSGKRIELNQSTTGQILGEQRVFSNVKANLSAEALSEVKALEVPVEVLKSQYEKSSPGVKILTKGLFEELKRLRSQWRSLKLEQDSSPCPPRYIPRVFSIFTLVGKYLGNLAEPSDLQGIEVKESFPEKVLVVSWESLRLYGTRMFLESPQRMQGMLEVLKKLNHVELSYKKDEDTEEEVMDKIFFLNMDMIEGFGEFFQHYLFKPGKSEIISFDSIAHRVAGIFLDITKDRELDRNGLVTLEYETLLKNLKEDYGLDLKATHLDLLEKKGLFVKRKTVNDKVHLSFERKEFQMIFDYWSILSEIDKWNKKGYVDLTENLSLKKESRENKCPQCEKPYESGQNFCAFCGFKLAEAA
ncbi:MAG: hypothetical protein D6797_02145 [Bdellovibrio sp.]|nr:MAG: hypothetical protein D6797_02145 [Bdellovibrio sp.]